MTPASRFWTTPSLPPLPNTRKFLPWRRPALLIKHTHWLRLRNAGSSATEQQVAGNASDARRDVPSLELTTIFAMAASAVAHHASARTFLISPPPMGVTAISLIGWGRSRRLLVGSLERLMTIDFHPTRRGHRQRPLTKAMPQGVQNLQWLSHLGRLQPHRF
jgi:hypothetical protein